MHHRRPCVVERFILKNLTKNNIPLLKVLKRLQNKRRRTRREVKKLYVSQAPKPIDPDIVIFYKHVLKLASRTLRSGIISIVKFLQKDCLLNILPPSYREAYDASSFMKSKFINGNVKTSNLFGWVSCFFSTNY